MSFELKCLYERERERDRENEKRREGLGGGGIMGDNSLPEVPKRR